MSGNNKAIYRVIYVSKDKKTKAKCATLWSTQFPDQLSFSPVIEPNPKYNEMAFKDALVAYLNKDGYLNVQSNAPKQTQEADDFE